MAAPSPYKVPLTDARFIAFERLRALAAHALERGGLPTPDAELAADVLAAADLRGVESHGVSNMLRVYLEDLAAGRINPRPEWRVVREAPSTATVDSDRGLGLVVVPRAMRLAIQKARQTGVGMVTINNGRHLGMAAYHAMLALPHDMIGVCTTAVQPRVVPTFGRIPRLGTNPIALAAPAGAEPPFVFDAATSVVPANALRNARRLGTVVPGGLMAAEDGTPITTPGQVLDDAERLLPLGSIFETGSHKGYGLGSIVEILCGVLSGGGFAVRHSYNHANHFVAALDIAAFVDVATFKADLDDFLRTLKSTPPAPGHERVLVAGQLEWEAQQQRSQHGIPLHPDVLAWLERVGGGPA